MTKKDFTDASKKSDPKKTTPKPAKPEQPAKPAQPTKCPVPPSPQPRIPDGCPACGMG